MGTGWLWNPFENVVLFGSHIDTDNFPVSMLEFNDLIDFAMRVL